MIVSFFHSGQPATPLPSLSIPTLPCTLQGSQLLQLVLLVLVQ